MLLALRKVCFSSAWQLLEVLSCHVFFSLIRAGTENIYSTRFACFFGIILD